MTTVTFSDEASSLTITGRYDDGSDESLVLLKVAEKALLNGIGNFNRIEKPSYM